MKISTRKLKKIDVADSGALSDLAFLLIIFFIVIAVFNVNSGFILGLPQKNSTKIVNKEDIIKLDLTESGEVFINGESQLLSDMEQIISGNLETHPNLTVLLRVKPEVPYQKVVSLIEIIRKLEVDNFSFTMAEEGSL